MEEISPLLDAPSLPALTLLQKLLLGGPDSPAQDRSFALRLVSIASWHALVNPDVCITAHPALVKAWAREEKRWKKAGMSFYSFSSLFNLFPSCIFMASLSAFAWRPFLHLHVHLH